MAQLARSLRSARARRGPLRHRVAVGRGHTVKCFILTRIYKGSAKAWDFHDKHGIGIVATVAASRFPEAAPQKHKDFPLVLKVAPVGSSGDAPARFAPGLGRHSITW